MFHVLRDGKFCLSTARFSELSTWKRTQDHSTHRWNRFAIPLGPRGAFRRSPFQIRPIRLIANAYNLPRLSTFLLCLDGTTFYTERNLPQLLQQTLSSLEMHLKGFLVVAKFILLPWHYRPIQIICKPSKRLSIFLLNKNGFGPEALSLNHLHQILLIRYVPNF